MYSVDSFQSVVIFLLNAVKSDRKLCVDNCGSNILNEATNKKLLSSKTVIRKLPENATKLVRSIDYLLL